MTNNSLMFCVVLLAGCHGPPKIDYRAAAGQPPKKAREAFQEVPLRRFALSPRGSLERQLWERVAQAVELANRFIASEANRYFPQGRRFRATEDGRLFVDSDAADGFRMHVRVSAMATLLTEFGYSAQEDADGFAVGALKEVHGLPIDVTIANTLFFTLDGRWRPADMMAALFLHETMHTLQVRAQGQVSYWVEYYVRAGLLFQGGGPANELEKVAYRVETEFWRWADERE